MVTPPFPLGDRLIQVQLYNIYIWQNVLYQRSIYFTVSKMLSSKLTISFTLVFFFSTVLQDCSHPGVAGLLIHLLKEQVDQALSVRVVWFDFQNTCTIVDTAKESLLLLYVRDIKQS